MRLAMAPGAVATLSVPPFRPCDAELERPRNAFITAVADARRASETVPMCHLARSR
jgi:hypothetical protein